jgi:hypothetical protein
MHGQTTSGGDARNQGRGFVLPVVLIMVVLMTSVVLLMIRRGTVDERLASNVRAVTTLEAAAQYALRSCELWIWSAPPGIAAETGRPSPPRTMQAPVRSDATTAPAWSDAANWDGTTAVAVTLPVDNLPNVTAARCLIEDARDELDLTTNSLDGNRLALAPTWRKYRVTSEVRSGSALVGVRIVRAQSEIRMNVN